MSEIDKDLTTFFNSENASYEAFIARYVSDGMGFYITPEIWYRLLKVAYAPR